MKRILSIEFKNIFRNNAFQIGVLVVFLFGLYGIYYGNRVIEEQKENISRIEHLENESIEHILHIAGAENTAGTDIYYMIFHTYNPPSGWAAFSLGQRDILNYNIKTKILALEGQIYDNELTNPLSLLVGNLDLSFVFIYLFPLLIIALGFSLISEEKETGVWSMIKISGVPTLSFVFYKIFARWLIVVSLIVILMIVAALVFRAGFGAVFFAILGISILYVIFWFAVVWLINSLNKNSTYNAILSVGIWIVLCLMFPALGNTIITATTPVHEAMETTLIQREAYHEKWDKPKSVTMNKFYQEYPEYKKYKIPEEKYYVAGWYYAMQYVADKEAEPTSKQMEQKLMERQHKAETLGMFLPTVGVQRMYNTLVNTDLEAHMRYLASVRKHHKAVREFFYPYIFEETLTKNTPWEKRPKYQPPAEKTDISWKSLFVCFLYSLLLVFIGIKLTKKI